MTSNVSGIGIVEISLNPDEIESINQLPLLENSSLMRTTSVALVSICLLALISGILQPHFLLLSTLNWILIPPLLSLSYYLANKTYWNDPRELVKIKATYVDNDFAANQKIYGWDKLVSHPVFDRSILLQKLIEAAEKTTLFDFQKAYGDLNKKSPLFETKDLQPIYRKRLAETSLRKFFDRELKELSISLSDLIPQNEIKEKFLDEVADLSLQEIIETYSWSVFDSKPNDSWSNWQTFNHQVGNILNFEKYKNELQELIKPLSFTEVNNTFSWHILLNRHFISKGDFKNKIATELSSGTTNLKILLDQLRPKGVSLQITSDKVAKTATFDQEYIKVGINESGVQHNIWGSKVLLGKKAVHMKDGGIETKLSLLGSFFGVQGWSFLTSSEGGLLGRYSTSALYYSTYPYSPLSMQGWNVNIDEALGNVKIRGSTLSVGGLDFKTGPAKQALGKSFYPLLENGTINLNDPLFKKEYMKVLRAEPLHILIQDYFTVFADIEENLLPPSWREKIHELESVLDTASTNRLDPAYLEKYISKPWTDFLSSQDSLWIEY